MAAFVLDASVAVTWVLPDRAAASTEALHAQGLVEGVAVPAVWPLEVANVLRRRQRRGLLPEADRLRAVAVLGLVKRDIDAASIAFPFTAGDALAERHRLSSYDASYLELAIRRTLPLDAALRRAAAAEGVALLPA